MARRIREYTVTGVNRDQGKTFRLTELSADQGERWAVRFALALAHGGSNIPREVLEAGMSGLASTWPNFIATGLVSLQGVEAATIIPLLDEMIECVQYLPPSGLPPQSIFPGINSQIEEVSTRARLRFELIELHLGFSLADALTTTAQTAEAPPV